MLPIERCPLCGERHERKPGEITCAPTAPRASPPVVPSAAQFGGVSRTASAPAVPIAPGSAASLGLRVAGACFIANALAAIFAMATLKQVTQNDAGSAFQNPIAFLIDLGVGASLLSGNEQLRPLALFRVAAGALIFSGLHLAHGDFYSFALQIAFSGTLLALLVGTPGKGRVAAGALAAVLALGVNVLVVAMIAAGENPLAAVKLVRESDAIDGDVVHGPKDAWTLHKPSPGWRQLRPEIATQQNALSDAWLVLPSADAHILVLHETVPNARRIDIAKLRDLVVANFKKSMPDVELVDETKLETPLDHATLLHLRATYKTLPLEYDVALFTRGGEIYHVRGWTARSRFGAVEPELRRAIQSFELAPR